MQKTPTLRKLPATSVTYGTDISTRGNFVWGAFDGDKLMCYAATKAEARRKYARGRWMRMGQGVKISKRGLLPSPSLVTLCIRF
jgi:hypothetical protein